jgi:hypothetical protein
VLTVQIFEIVNTQQDAKHKNNSNPTASTSHIQRTHVIRQAYKAIFTKNLSEHFIITSHIFLKLLEIHHFRAEIKWAFKKILPQA